MAEELDAWRAGFIKKFASLPGPLRSEIVAVVDGEPFSWSAAYLEVSNKTNKGNEILKLLKALKVL